MPATSTVSPLMVPYLPAAVRLQVRLKVMSSLPV
jgi:hypothetical protein